MQIAGSLRLLSHVVKKRVKNDISLDISNREESGREEQSVPHCDPGWFCVSPHSFACHIYNKFYNPISLQGCKKLLEH